MTDTKSQVLKTAKLFEFYVKYFWPCHRLFVRRQIARRCKQCGASEKMIPLLASGLCQACTQTDSKSGSKSSFKAELSNPPNTELAKELNSILKSHQRRGSSDYDALVLFSGGKDSTYLIRRIQNEFPQMRLLSFTIDNGFMSPVAKENIAELIPKLGIDHLFVTPQREFYLKLFRYAVTHLNTPKPEENFQSSSYGTSHIGSYGTVDFSDGEFMLDTARRIAAEKHIPLILCGYSKYQVQNGLGLHHFESPPTREQSDRKATAGMTLSDIFSEEEIHRWWHGSRWPKEQVARLLFPLYAWDLEEPEIKRQVIQWGLMIKEKQSPIVTNHQLIPLLGVVDVHLLGYSSFEIEFCRMIREGKANRQDWQGVFEFLEYTARTGLFVKPTILQSLATLRLSLEDVGIRFSQ